MTISDKLYPAIQPYNQFMLPVTDGHEIYVEESGNPNGIAIIYCHGGPGGASSAMQRQLFNPEQYRIILFDQRGCGHSKPHLSIQHNTTDSLISDMAHIRQHLAISKWVVAGGSWGTTLGLLYAQQYPSHTQALLLRGIFLGRKQDLDWLYQADGAARLFPDYYHDFISFLQRDNAHLTTSADIIKAYLAKLTSQNQIEQLAAAKHWSAWESKISCLYYPAQTDHTLPHERLEISLLEAHYFAHHCFIDENQILDNMDKINTIPATLIHGRYDCVCDVSQAWQLSKAWQSSQLYIVPNAGHSLTEVGIADGFVKAANAMAIYLTEQS